MELINNLVEKLGVSSEQAKGGSSLIFNMVKENLDAEDFSKIVSKVPGISSLVSDNKEEEVKEDSGSFMDKVGDMFGGDKGEDKGGSFMDKAADMFGSSSGVLDSLGLENLGSMAKLTSGFNKLGLDSSTVTKFLPVVMNFVKSKGGSAISDLVLKALK